MKITRKKPAKNGDSTFGSKRPLTLACLLAAGLLLAGCAAKPTTKFDSSYDFSPPKNFSWASENPLKVAPGSKPLNPAAEQHLMDATANALRSKGYTLVGDIGKSDIAVGFTLGTREEMAMVAYDDFTANDDVKELVQSGGSAVEGAQTMITYNKSQLAMDFFDVTTRQQVWHGTHYMPVSDSTRENPKEGLTELVGLILSSFPP
jgi:hypothetical protein